MVEFHKDGSIVISADDATFGAVGPSVTVGITIHSEAGVVAAFRQDENGHLVEVEPEDAIVGVHVDENLRSRWMSVRDVSESPDLG